MTIIGYLFKRVSAFVKNSRPKLKLRAKILKTQGKNPKLKETRQKGLQNNWLLMLSLQSWFSKIGDLTSTTAIHTPSKCVIMKGKFPWPRQSHWMSHTKECIKMCDHEKINRPRELQKLSIQWCDFQRQKWRLLFWCQIWLSKCRIWPSSQVTSTRGVISLTKDRHKTCGPPKFFKVPEISKLFEGLELAILTR